MPSTNNQLSAILRSIGRAGDFYAAGRSEMAPPNLQVDGVGLISLPFQQQQLDALLARASLAPFGRGADTVTDTSVRRTWQIDAAQVHFGGRRWQAWLDGVVAAAAAGLGVTLPVTAQLYKLLIYDTGSFFVEHRDTEKVAGMFATLVLVLPSVYEGGALLVRHGGREARLELRGDDPSDAAYAAFYADCVHEVQPVTSGTRLSLIYNLSWADGGAAGAPPPHLEQQAALTQLLARRAAAPPDAAGDAARKLVYPLAHAYSAAELGFSTLKLADAVAGRLLLAAAGAAGYDVYLAQLEIHESGSAEEFEPRRARRWSRASRWHDNDDGDDDSGAGDAGFEVLEIFERDAHLSGWRAADGGAPAFGRLPLEDAELCPLDGLDQAEPDEQHFRGTTGNEGASFERTYRRAALVLWPSGARLAVLMQGGPAAALPYLEQLLRARGGGAGPGGDDAEARQLAALLVRDFPVNMAPPPPIVARLLDCLVDCGDAALIEQFLLAVPATGVYGGAENAALARAAQCLAPRRAADLIERVIAANAAFSIDAVAALLSLCSRWRGVAPALLLPAAGALLDGLTGRHATSADAERWRWRRRVAVGADGVRDTLQALHRIGAEELAGAALAHMLSSLDLDRVLLPAALALADADGADGGEGGEGGEGADGAFAPLGALRLAVLQRVRQRIALDLAPPPDWRRASALECDCADCAALARFLADPAAPDWRFAAAQSRRLHVEAAIRAAVCDLDLETVRKGNPHTLVCTKNQASYQRRVQQRVQDVAHERRLME